MSIKYSLLFWDILFLPLPNVFETPFQTAPLDLPTDAFYPTRASEINHRLVAIGNGKAGEYIKATYEREKEKSTWCVGLNWTYSLEDLVEVAEVDILTSLFVMLIRLVHWRTSVVSYLSGA
jgi:Fanconi-associated nuclease 1